MRVCAACNEKSNREGKIGVRQRVMLPGTND